MRAGAAAAGIGAVSESGSAEMIGVRTGGATEVAQMTEAGGAYPPVCYVIILVKHSSILGHLLLEELRSPSRAGTAPHHTALQRSL